MSGLPCKRRTFLLLAAALTTSCSAGDYDGPHRTLRITAGEVGGFYKEFADFLARELNEAETDLEAAVDTSTGSIVNLNQVHAGRADLGLALVDAAAAAFAGEPPFTEAVPLRAIGRVYENYLQLVVLADSPIWSVADLEGRRISLGADGSGAALTGERLLAASAVSAEVEHQQIGVAVRNLAQRRIDALLWSGGVPTPVLAELAGEQPIRLVDLADHVGTLQDRRGLMYRRVVVPDSVYSHPGPITTVGVANLLVSASSLPDDVADAVARVLIRRAPDLVPPQALGTQYLDRRSMIATTPVPLHPGAARAYRDLRD